MLISFTRRQKTPMCTVELMYFSTKCIIVNKSLLQCGWIANLSLLICARVCFVNNFQDLGNRRANDHKCRQKVRYFVHVEIRDPYNKT